MNNKGIWMFCGLVCVWPLIVTFSYRFLERRVKTQGWRSLLPPYGGKGGGDVSL